ncbi:MAG TPA: DUF4401 domain-containing protein [Burkholderiales bacterium]|nr:DUF4401 domain-containing protein [Burkholderiales bacterium]
MNGSAQRLWETLCAAGVASGHAPPGTEPHSPWYVRAMLGVAGWIAAAFLFGFVGQALPWVVDSKTAALAVGTLMIAAAYALFRVEVGRDFVGQFALAMSLAGQALAAIGVFGVFQPREALAWSAIAAGEAILAVLLPNFVHRVWSGYAAAMCAALALVEGGAAVLAVGVVGAGAAWLWSRELAWAARSSLVRPIAYGLTLGLIQIQGDALFMQGLLGMLAEDRDQAGWAQPWVGQVLTGLVLVGAVAHLVASDSRLARRDAMIALAAAVGFALLSLRAPGIATGVMLVALGFAGGNRVLTGLGVAALLFYLGAYYYTLQATLLAKSAVLAATGAALLAARWALTRWLFRGREDAHA